MARYIPLVWKDRNIQRPNTFQVTDNPDGTKTLTPKPGTIIEKGTLVNAENLNHIEQGIKDIDINVNDIKVDEVIINNSMANLDIESLVEIKNIKGRTLKNEIKNGDFSDVGLKWKYWSAANGTVSVTNKTLTLTGNGQLEASHIYQAEIFTSVSDKYYICVMARVLSNVCKVLRIGSWSMPGWISVNNPEQNKWYKLSGIKQGYTDRNMLVSQLYADASTANGQSLETTEILCVNLTTMFGVGKEPSIEWCDTNIKWFDGIKSAGEQEGNKITINSIGKNLIDAKKDFDRSNNNFVLTRTENGFILEATQMQTYPYGGYLIRVKPNTQYILQRQFRILSGGVSSTGKVYIYDKEVKNAIAYADPNIKNVTFTSPSDGYIYILFYAKFAETTVGVKVEFYNIQLEEGATATQVEKYKFASSNIQLTEPLKGLPSTSDEIIKGKIIKKINKIILNGSQNIGIVKVDTNTVLFSYLLSDIVKPTSDSIDIISDNFQSKLNYGIDEEGCFISTSKYLYIRILKSKLSTPDSNGMKSWLASNPTSFYYELATPIEESLNQSLNIKTFNKGTILLENNIIPAVNNLNVPNSVAGRVSNLEEFIPIINNNIDIIGKGLAKHKTSNDHDDRYVKVSDIKSTILNITYPIGTIYQSIINTSPAIFLGGTWVEFGQGKVLVGIDKNDVDFNAAEKTGGNKTQPLRALMGATNSDVGKIGYQSAARVPGHDYSMGISGTSYGGANNANINHSTVVKKEDGAEPTTLQPYITVYMWKRTA